MAVLQTLDAKLVNEAVQLAAERGIPLGITVRAGKRWMNLRSRLVEVRGEQLILELPTAADGSAPHQFSDDEQVGISFKLKHHKYLCAVNVRGAADGVLTTSWPTIMQRLQRRSYERVDVPSRHIVRASFWIGGREAEPTEPCPQRPVWSGVVTNLSAGGCQVRATGQAPVTLEVGYIMGMRLAFGVGGPTIYTDAQFRHAEEGENDALLGFQFVGLSQTPDGQTSLGIISRKVADYQREGA